MAEQAIFDKADARFRILPQPINLFGVFDLQQGTYNLYSSLEDA